MIYYKPFIYHATKRKSTSATVKPHQAEYIQYSTAEFNSNSIVIVISNSKSNSTIIKYTLNADTCSVLKFQR